MIKHVVLWQNGMVMVFDEYGDQIPEFQGRREEAIRKLKGQDLSQTVFEGGIWRESISELSKDDFFKDA